MGWISPWPTPNWAELFLNGLNGPHRPMRPCAKWWPEVALRSGRLSTRAVISCCSLIEIFIFAHFLVFGMAIYLNTIVAKTRKWLLRWDADTERRGEREGGRGNVVILKHAWVHACKREKISMDRQKYPCFFFLVNICELAPGSYLENNCLLRTIFDLN